MRLPKEVSFFVYYISYRYFVSKCVQIQEIGQKEKSASTDNQQLADFKGTQSGGRTRTPFSIGV